VRAQVSRKAIEMRRQGFSGAAMLPMEELEHTGVTDNLAELEKRFIVRVKTPAVAPEAGCGGQAARAMPLAEGAKQ